MPQTNEIKCPNCGQKVQVVDHPDKPDKLVAYCDCVKAVGIRPVWESDKDPAKPVKEEATK